MGAEAFGAVERDAAVGGGLCPASGCGDAAEREEMHSDLADPCGRRFGKRADDAIRCGGANEMLEQSGLPRQPLRRCAHAAAACVAKERRERGRAGEPYPYRMLDAEVAQPREP